MRPTPPKPYVGECIGCLAEDDRLLMPVLCVPGYWVLSWMHLCLDCRVGWEDSTYCALATTFLHMPAHRHADGERLPKEWA